MTANIAPLAYGTFYHIYNRGNNREDIFPQERNYAYFMDLWWTDSRYQSDRGDLGVLPAEESLPWGGVC